MPTAEMNLVVVYLLLYTTLVVLYRHQ